MTRISLRLWPAIVLVMLSVIEGVLLIKGGYVLTAQGLASIVGIKTCWWIALIASLKMTYTQDKT